jgi:hypothetical protein
MEFIDKAEGWSYFNRHGQFSETYEYWAKFNGVHIKASMTKTDFFGTRKYTISAKEKQFTLGEYYGKNDPMLDAAYNSAKSKYDAEQNAEKRKAIERARGLLNKK